MAAIPESTKTSITLRVLHHAKDRWPQLQTINTRFRSNFAYIDGTLADGSQIPLFRLRYGGSAHSFGFAIHDPATGS